jgi:hypothetical protein
LQLLGHVLHAGWAHDFELRAGLGHVRSRFRGRSRLPSRSFLRNTWRAVLSGGTAQQMPQAQSPCPGGGEAPAHRGCGLRPHRRLWCAPGGHGSFTRLLDGHVDQVADDGIHILAHIAHLGELGGFDLDERRIGQAGQAARNLGFAHACGADHEDVLGGDFVPQRLIDLLPAPAVAQRNGHGPLGGLGWPMMCLSSSETISLGVR